MKQRSRWKFLLRSVIWDDLGVRLQAAGPNVVLPNYGEYVTTHSPADRDREGVGLSHGRGEVALSGLDVLLSGAEREVELPSLGRSGARVAVGVVAAVVLLVLLVLVSSQWLLSVAEGRGGRTSCFGPDCVSVRMNELERRSGVDFPDGTTVVWSEVTKGPYLQADKESVHFLVRIPAGLPVPNPPQSWQNEPDPGLDVPTNVTAWERDGLTDIRWSRSGWMTGLDASGDALLRGLYG